MENSDENDLTQIERYLVQEWEELIHQDGIFNDETDTSKWLVNITNAQEFIEALNLENEIT